jgi:hypothetical protein
VYWNAIHQMIIASNWEMDAKSVTCDFEVALINAIDHHFVSVDNGAVTVFCQFHFLQANLRHLKSLRIATNACYELIRLLPTLTVIPMNEILRYGIPYIRSKVDETACQDKYDQYWKYFKTTWLGRYDCAMWNVHRLLDNNNNTGLLVNMTNNALERFNRELNDRFPGDHRPTMEEFVTGIKNLSVEKVTDLENIRRGLRPKPKQAKPNIPKVPEDYAEFVELLRAQEDEEEETASDNA